MQRIPDPKVNPTKLQIGHPIGFRAQALFIA
jgi:hypothetical protein